ncbi:hypothetical protein OR263_10865 [Streptomyces sp. NEAU-H22]|uniref:hypothetical protein n=1 Tax=unclassified Streptomyces TaxID=2593676 RepID=UPI00225A01B3|nr:MULTISPECIES: hypothetical protein [unclassified Streptomyces]MCX3287204.1 hypothetical protein [Streptomyces sp. NEAU-H22]WMD03003.1 hypothetical protein Q7C01_00785 [Streptomyces sp. FXY-T5]
MVEVSPVVEVPSPPVVPEGAVLVDGLGSADGLGSVVGLADREGDQFHGEVLALPGLLLVAAADTHGVRRLLDPQGRGAAGNPARRGTAEP